VGDLGESEILAASMAGDAGLSRSSSLLAVVVANRLNCGAHSGDTGESRSSTTIES
jgi:hypothetical protein